MAAWAHSARNMLIEDKSESAGETPEMHGRKKDVDMALKETKYFELFLVLKDDKLTCSTETAEQTGIQAITCEIPKWY